MNIIDQPPKGKDQQIDSVTQLPNIQNSKEEEMSLFDKMEFANS